MTTTIDVQLCAGGCGKTARKGSAYAHGHAHGCPTAPKLLPSPADLEAEDLGLIEPEPEPEPVPPGEVPDTETEPEPDEPPAHATKAWRQEARQPTARARKLRITAAVRGDIHAKISMPLEIGGRLWEARDAVCGGTFVKQREEIAGALTDIVCESADLVAFFTGPAGGFMRYLNLAAACWPVVEVALAHHIYHSIEQAPPEQRDLSAYAA